MIERYSAGARWYDVLSGERLVYGAGRHAGIRLLDPQPGDVVIDLGCGTGLNLPALRAAVGSSGLIVGIDRSADMLAMARRRIERHGWGDQVALIQADAVTIDPATIADVIRSRRGRSSADRLLATYALSVIGQRDDAWSRCCAALRSGARVAIVDMQYPTGRWRVFAPLAWLACRTGGADISARPWRMIEHGPGVTGVARERAKGGHLVAVAGDLAG